MVTAVSKRWKKYTQQIEYRGNFSFLCKTPMEPTKRIWKFQTLLIKVLTRFVFLAFFSTDFFSILQRQYFLRLYSEWTRSYYWKFLWIYLENCAINNGKFFISLRGILTLHLNFQNDDKNDCCSKRNKKISNMKSFHHTVTVRFKLFLLVYCYFINIHLSERAFFVQDPLLKFIYSFSNVIFCSSFIFFLSFWNL